MKLIEILLVEDSLEDAILIREHLLENKLHLVVHTVIDGEEATNFLYKRLEEQIELPDLILLDLNMPRKDGREVLAEIKAHAQLKHIPIIILTTSSNQEDIDFAYSHHVNSYIIKPLNLNDFIKIVASINNFWFTVVRLPKHTNE